MRLSKVRETISQSIVVLTNYITVIGERIVTPLSIVYLVVKLRVTPPSSDLPAKTENSDRENVKSAASDEFLAGRNDAEDMPKGASDGGWAHAPHWPSVWMILNLSISQMLILYRIEPQAWLVDRSCRPKDRTGYCSANEDLRCASCQSQYSSGLQSI